MITYKTREEVYAGILADTEKQVYSVPNSTMTGSFDHPFENVERTVRQFTEWLSERHYALPTAPERGTVDYYIYHDTLIEMMYVHWQSTGEQFRAWLLPQLIGYEGKTLEVVDKWGETQRFKLGTTGIWALQHTQVIPGDKHFHPVIGDPFQSIKIITDQLPVE